MKIQNYIPALNNAFTATGRNDSFIGHSFDYSFVGTVQNSGGFKKLVTLIAPNKVVAAKHYALNVNDVVEFYNTSNQKVTANVLSATYVDDIQIATIDADLAAAGVTVATVANYTKAEYKGKPTLVFGLMDGTREVVAALNTVAGFQAAGSQTSVTTQSQRSGTAIDFGDSGAPDFVINGSNLELIGPHWSISPMLFYTSAVGLLVKG